MLGLNMNGRVTPMFFYVNWVSQDCLFSQGFQRWISRAVLKSPRFVVLGGTSTLFLFLKTGFDRMRVFQAISRMDFCGDAENPAFCSAWLEDEWSFFCLKLCFERLLAFPGILEMDFSGGAENPTFRSAWL